MKNKKVLVLGGARFHGLLLAMRLAEENQVSVFNRGNFRTFYPSNINHIIGDRNNPDQLGKLLGRQEFDVVYDNNGYNGEQISNALDVLNRGFGKYVLTSSAAVYLTTGSSDPLATWQADGETNGFYQPNVESYARGKLEAEKILRRKVEDFTILRFPNIFGSGDFLGKFSYFSKRFFDGKPIILEKEVDRFSLISVNDAVDVMSEVPENSRTKRATLNVADPTFYTYDSFFNTFIPDYDKSLLILMPSQEIYLLGVRLPFSFGPMLDTSTTSKLLFKQNYLQLEEYARNALEWENSQENLRCVKEYPENRALEVALTNG